jgi:Fe-S cluster assembly protein SufD
MSLASALRTGDLDRLPGRRDEDWRWTDLRALIRVAPEPSPPVGEVAHSPLLVQLREPKTVYANGRRLSGEETAVAAGEDAMRLRRFVSASEGTAHHVEAPVEVEAGAHLLLIDSFEGQAAGYVADAHCAIRVGPGARLERVVLLADAADAVSVSLTEVELAPGAKYQQTVLASGAKRQRFETRVSHQGGGASARLDGIYVLSGQRQSDQTTQVSHDGTDGTTSQLTKGVATDQARGVFQGRIVVSEGADRTDARMGHHALMLSDRAEIDAKPELLIFADDVACAHGNTVGALDDEALFYAMSRGIPQTEARALLIGAFLAEVADRIEHIQARELAHEWLGRQLEGRAQ